MFCLPLQSLCQPEEKKYAKEVLSFWMLEIIESLYVSSEA